MLADHLRAMLAARHPDPGEDEADFGGAMRDAAVLIGITDRPQPGVILTQRPQWLRSHAGQVAFPGGKIDPQDDGPVGAALREADEEIALSPGAVTLVGTSEPFHSGSGYRITPVIGVIPPDYPFDPSPEEVEDWFEVPLATLFDPDLYVRQSGIWQGRERHYYDMPWQGRRIWGVTAGIIVNLARRLPREWMLPEWRA